MCVYVEMVSMNQMMRMDAIRQSVTDSRSLGWVCLVVLLWFCCGSVFMILVCALKSRSFKHIRLIHSAADPAVWRTTDGGGAEGEASDEPTHEARSLIAAEQNGCRCCSHTH